MSKTAIRIGWGLSAVVGLMLLMAGLMAAIFQPPSVREGFVQFGYPDTVARPIGFAALAGAILYLTPQTSVLGAIILTGYLGGATATHVRVGEWQFVMPVLVGILMWIGLYLRDARLRTLVPLRLPD